MSNLVCIVEPLSSANYLASRLRQEGYETVAIKVHNNPGVDIATLENMRNKIDFSLWDKVIDFDYNHELNELSNALKELGVDFVFYGCEFVVEFTDNLAASLNILHNNSKTALERCNKYIMQKAINNYGLKIPKQMLLSEIVATENLENVSKYLNLPFIVKPTNLFASIGLNVIESTNELKQFITYIPLDEIAGLIAQEKISGTEYIVDTFSIAGKHHISLVARYEKRLFNKNFLYQSIEFINTFEPEYQKISNYIKEVLNAVEFQTGFAHSELFITSNDELYLVEVNPRLSGAAGTINLLAKLCGGVDQISLLKSSTHEQITAKIAPQKYGKVIFTYNFIPNKIFNGINLELVTSLNSYRQHVIVKKNGDSLSVGGNLFDSYLYVVLVNDSLEQLNEDCSKLVQLEESGNLLV